MAEKKLQYGLISAAEDELNGRELHDLMDSLGQMARGEFAEDPDPGQWDEMMKDARESGGDNAEG